MNAPIELLYLGHAEPPDLSFSPYGPLVVHPATSFAQVDDALAHSPCDALVLDLSDAAALAGWPGLAQAAAERAVLVLLPEPEAADALRLVRLGVQDVLPRREAGPTALGRLVRLAVERKRLEREARRAYATDLATGLPNHAQLMEHMTHLLALREREPAAMALLLLRVTGLAAAASRLGTEAANVLRRKVAVRLRSGLRASDVVAATGDDSFAVMLAWIDAAADGQRVADKLVTALQRPFSVAGQDVAVGVAVGVAQYPLHGKDAHALMQCAASLAAQAPARGRIGVGGAPAPSAANDE